MCTHAVLRSLALTAVAVCGLLGGCRVAAPLAQHPVTAEVEAIAGTYAGDGRWAALERGFPERVAAALDRLETLGGLRFPTGRRPRVVLRPFGDERVPYELRTVIQDGHRRVTLHVNAEPILGRVRESDPLLVRALAEAAFQDAAQRHGSVPRWLTELAGIALAGELERHLTGLQRRALDGDPEALRVDGEDAGVAEQTGVAALLLITERGRPDEVRHLLQSVADGDRADAVMARLAHEPDGTWMRPASTVYRLTLEGLDAEPWRLLQRAEAAATDAGGAGLEAILPAEIPAEIRAEVLVLRAQAASDEGDHGRAARLLGRMEDDAPSRLRDPAAALALRIRVESHAGGDAALARRLALELDLDFPRSEARRTLRRKHPLLGMEEDPQRWLLGMRGRIEQNGTDEFDLGTLERYTRTLLLDHRVGAAALLLTSLGPRGRAPELDGLTEAVREAADDPTQATLERAAERVAAWRERPTEATARDVRDTGRPARAALGAALDAAPERERREVLRLAAETLGEAAAVRLAQQDWNWNVRCIDADFESLAALVSYDVLKAREDPPQREPGVAARCKKAWESVTLGLSDAWLSAHPDFLRDLRSETYAVRQATLASISVESPEEATPALVARGLRDPAALLRRDAAVLAGTLRFAALARVALRDPAWLVREAAVRSVTAIEAEEAVDVLLGLLREDVSREVRGAAALGLLQVAAGETRVLDALLATQVEEDAVLRDAVAARLAQLDALTVVRGIERGWARALRRDKPNNGYLFRTAVLYQRLTRQDLGYYPGATREEIRGMHARMRRWMAGREKDADTSSDVRLVRADGDDGR